MFRKYPRNLITFLLVAGVLSSTAFQVQAARPQSPDAGAIINVNTTSDDFTNNGNCTLREAIQAANTNQARDACPAGISSGSGVDTIVLPSGTFTLAIPATPETDDNSVGDLDITESVNLRGVDPEVTIINGNQIDRVIQISGQSPSLTKISIYNLTIENGKANSTLSILGGGIYNQSASLSLSNMIFSNNYANNSGGALMNQGGSISLANSTFLNNQAGLGGAFLNSSGYASEIRNSTFYMNQSTKESGGAIDNSSVLDLFNTTFYLNSAKSTGGAIFSDGSVTITSSTFSDNTAIDDGSGIGTNNYMSVIDTIFYNNTCSYNLPAAAPESSGHNIEYNTNPSITTSCLIKSTDPTDLKNTNPGLGTYAMNGGKIPTINLLANSTAIDKGDGSQCPFLDARSYGRTDGDGNGTTICDIGAFEYGGIAHFLYLPLAKHK